MKKRIFILLLSSFTINCYCQTGTISGNAFWKYNNYVGNKPDAGAYVFAFPSDTTSALLETQCDVQGNFKFENVPSGKYLIVIRSKNTNSSGSDTFSELYYAPTKKYLGFNIREIDSTMCDSIQYYKKNIAAFEQQKVPMWNIKKYLKQSELVNGQYRNAITKILGEIPRNPRYDKVWFDAPILGKLYMDEIEVKDNQTKTVIADFGITYSSVI